MCCTFSIIPRLFLPIYTHLMYFVFKYQANTMNHIQWLINRSCLWQDVKCYASATVYLFFFIFILLALSNQLILLCQCFNISNFTASNEYISMIVFSFTHEMNAYIIFWMILPILPLELLPFWGWFCIMRNSDWSLRLRDTKNGQNAESLFSFPFFVVSKACTYSEPLTNWWKQRCTVCHYR